MTKSDFKKFCGIMNCAALATNKKDVTREGISFCFKALSQYELKDIEEAIFYLIRKCKFYPTVAEIVAHIEGSNEEQAGVAWARVDKAVSGKGKTACVKFTDPRIHYAISHCGGWVTLCGKQINDIWLEKKFKAAYQEAEKKNISWEYPGIRSFFPGTCPNSEVEIIDCGELYQMKALPIITEEVTESGNS